MRPSTLACEPIIASQYHKHCEAPKNRLPNSVLEGVSNAAAESAEKKVLLQGVSAKLSLIATRSSRLDLTLPGAVKDGQESRVSKAGCLAEAQHSIGLRSGHAGIGCPLRMETCSAYGGHT